MEKIKKIRIHATVNPGKIRIGRVVGKDIKSKSSGRGSKD